MGVPAKLSARAPGVRHRPGPHTDPVAARSIAVVALCTPGLRQVAVDDTTVALRLLVDRRDQLGRTRTEVVSRLHHLLLRRRVLGDDHPATPTYATNLAADQRSLGERDWVQIRQRLGCPAGPTRGCPHASHVNRSR